MSHAIRLLEFPSSAREGRCVLVIEGDADLRMSLRLSLEVAGWTVWEAPTAAAGLAALRLGGPVVVALGTSLPDSDTLSVLAELKASPATSAVPVVVVDGRADPRADGVGGVGGAARVLRAGAFDHLGHPFSGYELQERLASALRFKEWSSDSE